MLLQVTRTAREEEQRRAPGPQEEGSVLATSVLLPSPTQLQYRITASNRETTWDVVSSRLTRVILLGDWQCPQASEGLSWGTPAAPLCGLGKATKLC